MQGPRLKPEVSPPCTSLPDLEKQLQSLFMAVFGSLVGRRVSMIVDDIGVHASLDSCGPADPV